MDGRGPDTRLLPVLLEALGLSAPEAIPPWVGRAEKSEIAALAVHALRLAEAGDAVAASLLDHAAAELAAHAAALVDRLGPWPGEVPVVLHGGVVTDPGFRQRVGFALGAHGKGLVVHPAEADAVTGAVRFARELAHS